MAFFLLLVTRVMSAFGMFTASYACKYVQFPFRPKQKLNPTVSQEFPTHAASSVTSLAWDSKTTGTLFATGHADGSLHIFDRRLRPGAVFRTSEGHRAWVRNVHWQTRGRGELVSGSADGTVIVWDVRKAVPSVITIPQPRGLASMAVHNEANVIVT